jgi:hypothetical protein
MNKIIALILGVGIVGFLVYGFISSSIKKPPPPLPVAAAQKVDYSAGFAIFTNGTFRVFTAAMYHNLSEDVYIQADSPNVIRVKKFGTTWNDCFKTLPFKLTKDCLITGTKETFCTGNRGALKFYLNGEINEDILNREIKNGDKLLISYGSEFGDSIKKQINRIP